MENQFMFRPALIITSLLFCTAGIDAAQSQSAPVQQQGQSGGVYEMPKNNETTPTDPNQPESYTEAPGPGIPMGEDAYRKLKQKQSANAGGVLPTVTPRPAPGR